METLQPNGQTQALEVPLKTLVDAARIKGPVSVNLDSFSPKRYLSEVQGASIMRQTLAYAIAREEQGISPLTIAKEISHQFNALQPVFDHRNGGVIKVFELLPDEERKDLSKRMSLSLKMRLDCPDIGECKAETVASYIIRAAKQGKEKIADQEELNDLAGDESRLLAEIISSLDENGDSRYVQDVFAEIAQKEDDPAFICRRIMQVAEKEGILEEARDIFIKAGLFRWAEKCDLVIRGRKDIEDVIGLLD